MKHLSHLLHEFHHQIDYAFKHYNFPELNVQDYQNIVISGLGGSGIAGRIIKSMFSESVSIPVEAISEYTIPRFVNEKTLFIGASYSGNTEETIHTCHLAKERGAKILNITSGGQILDFAKSNNYPYCYIEPGYPPRMALGYSLTYLIILFSQLSGQTEELEAFKSAYGAFKNTDPYREKAQSMLDSFSTSPENKFTIFTDTLWHGVGVRFTQQLQENAKTESTCFFLPEAMHNVLETLYGTLPTHFILLHSSDGSRMDLNFNYIKQTLEKGKNSVIDMNVKKDIFSIYEAIHILDWLSLMWADRRGKKSDEIDNIWGLKAYLSENK